MKASRIVQKMVRTQQAVVVVVELQEVLASYAGENSEH